MIRHCAVKKLLVMARKLGSGSIDWLIDWLID